MATTSKRKNKNGFLKTWLCYKNFSNRGQTYIQVTSDLLNCKEFCSLHYSAQMLYLHMAVVAGQSMNFEYALGLYKNAFTQPTFRKARDELVEKGFIEVVEQNKNTRRPNKYRFSSKWRNTEN